MSNPAKAEAVRKAEETDCVVLIIRQWDSTDTKDPDYHTHLNRGLITDAIFEETEVIFEAVHPGGTSFAISRDAKDLVK